MYWERGLELRTLLKAEWKELWKTKYDDNIRAEEVSSEDFSYLKVDKGEIIHATRDFKPISFREILEGHLGSDMAEKIDPDPKTGGWRKFAREHLQKAKPVKKRRERPRFKADASQHQRKGGAGWINRNRLSGKIRLSE